MTDNSSSESTLKALVHNEHYRGVGSGLLCFTCSSSAADADNPWRLNFDGTTGIAPIYPNIGIEGVIDLNKGNPLFHNFPIITRNMGELYIRLYMENFLRELKVVYLNKSRSIGQSITTPGTSTSTNAGKPQEWLPYQRLPIDKPDFVFLDGNMYKIKIINKVGNPTPAAACSFNLSNPVFTLNDIEWKRFEIRKIEFDIEDRKSVV